MYTLPVDFSTRVTCVCVVVIVFLHTKHVWLIARAVSHNYSISVCALPFPYLFRIIVVVKFIFELVVDFHARTCEFAIKVLKKPFHAIREFFSVVSVHTRIKCRFIANYCIFNAFYRIIGLLVFSRVRV